MDLPLHICGRIHMKQVAGIHVTMRDSWVAYSVLHWVWLYIHCICLFLLEACLDSQNYSIPTQDLWYYTETVIFLQIWPDHPFGVTWN